MLVCSGQVGGSCQCFLGHPAQASPSCALRSAARWPCLQQGHLATCVHTRLCEGELEPPRCLAAHAKPVLDDVQLSTRLCMMSCAHRLYVQGCSLCCMQRACHLLGRGESPLMAGAVLLELPAGLCLAIEKSVRTASSTVMRCASANCASCRPFCCAASASWAMATPEPALTSVPFKACSSSCAAAAQWSGLPQSPCAVLAKQARSRQVHADDSRGAVTWVSGLGI